MATREAGRSWRAITPPGVAARRTMAVLFSDRRHGIVVMSTDAPSLRAPLDFYLTADGGRSWRRSTTIPRQATVGGATLASHGDRVWALTGEQGTMGSNCGGHLYLSEDRGASWRELPPPPLASASLGFNSVTEGWLDGGVGRQALWRTGDGGRSWGAGGPPTAERVPPGLLAKLRTAADLPWRLRAPGGDLREALRSYHGRPLRTVGTEERLAAVEDASPPRRGRGGRSRRLCHGGSARDLGRPHRREVGDDRLRTPFYLWRPAAHPGEGGRSRQPRTGQLRRPRARAGPRALGILSAERRLFAAQRRVLLR
jgi:photosystem II stability/assembly factor-like uncharacterized protein